MKPLTDPGKGKPEKDEKDPKVKREKRIKALVPPLVGDTVDGKKVTLTSRKKVKDSLRATRKAGWESTR